MACTDGRMSKVFHMLCDSTVPSHAIWVAATCVRFLRVAAM